MYKVPASLTFLLLSISLMAGCGEQKKAAVTDSDQAGERAIKPAASPSDHNEPAVATKAETPGQTPAKDASETANSLKPTGGESTATTAQTQESPVRTPPKPLTEAVFLPDNLVGISVLHPKAYFETRMGRLLIELGFETESGTPSDLLRRLGLKFSDLERVTVAIDQSLVTGIAQQVGLPVANLAAPAPQGDHQYQNAMKQIALAFHNYHDTFGKFPRANGDGDGRKTGLSWRVHLLPFLEQAPLYNEFHLDEPWDSDHNKTLIALMPAIFESPGVTEEGHTAFHVFTGENTPFHGDSGTHLSLITDGTSNTVLAIQSAPDKAEIWTKPGGLEVDLASPRDSLGEDPEEGFLVAMGDGQVLRLPVGIDDKTLAAIIHPRDGAVVDLNKWKVNSPKTPPLPTTIIELSREVPQAELVKSVLGESKEETFEGVSYSRNQSTAVWFPATQTVVVAPIEAVKQMISAKQAGKSSTSPLVKELNLASSISAAVDLESQASILGFLAQFNPMLGMVSEVKTIAMQFSGTGDPADPMLALDITATSSEKAASLFGISSMALNQGKMNIAQAPLAPNASNEDREMMALTKQLVASTTLEQLGEKIHFGVPVPKNFDQMPEIMKPALVSGQKTARMAIQMTAIREIGLGFHQYHDVHGAFPSASRVLPGKPKGLSWRVALLPYIGQKELYDQFNLDEAWDSEHNKLLIEKMPEVFKSKDVTEPGKTAMHVFVGAGAPFADDAAPPIPDFSDGASNTILAVLAGPDKAEIWTKPGGLDYDPENPIAALGDLTTDSFIAQMADGRVITLNKKTPAEQLRRLIQIADGEMVR